VPAACDERTGRLGAAGEVCSHSEARGHYNVVTPLASHLTMLLIDYGNADRAFEIRCSFCNHAERDVDHIVGGPGVFICNNCVDLCLGIILDQPDNSPHPSLVAAYRNRRVELDQDAERLTELLSRKAVSRVSRDAPGSLVIEFMDGTRLSVQGGRYNHLSTLVAKLDV